MAKINVRDRNKNTGRRPNWEYRFEIASVAGKRQNATKSGFRTKKEALEAGAKALAEYYASGEHFTPSTVSLSDYLDFWLENYGKNHWKDTTLQGRTYIVERNIKPALGKYRLSSITPSVLQTFINGFRVRSISFWFHQSRSRGSRYATIIFNNTYDKRKNNNHTRRLQKNSC